MLKQKEERQFSSVDTLWTLLGTVLVFFMQAGSRWSRRASLCQERSEHHHEKSYGLCTGSLGFFPYRLQHHNGDEISPASSELPFYLWKDLIPPFLELSIWRSKIVFAATAATIVSGALRNGQNSALISCTLSSFPVDLLPFRIPDLGRRLVGSNGLHWFCWPQPYMVGGVAALVGVAVVGPRIGKYKDGKRKSFLANLTIASYLHPSGSYGSIQRSINGCGNWRRNPCLDWYDLLNTNLSAVTATLVTPLIQF